MMGGRIEVVRSDIRHKDLRLVIAAVEGYAKRIFANEGGIAGLPGAIGQCGLGSRDRVSQEMSSKAKDFACSLEQFLSRHLPPSGWNIVWGGRIGFAVKGKQRATAVLRATSGEKGAPVSARTSCVFLIYRAPSAIGELPSWLLKARDTKLIAQSESDLFKNVASSHSLDSASLSDGKQQSNHKTSRDEKSDNNIKSASVLASVSEQTENDSSSNTEDIITQAHNFTKTEYRKSVTGKKGLQAKIKIDLFSVVPYHSVSNSLSSSVSKSSVSISHKVICPPLITEWGFLELSKTVQLRKLEEAFKLTIKKYQEHQSDNLQQLAQILRDELMIISEDYTSGPLWHVCIGREDITFKTGGTPMVQFAAEWVMPKSTPTSGKLRVIGFQLVSPPITSLCERFMSISPYIATALLCLFWMLKSRLCDDEFDSRSKSKWQQILAQRLCGHQGLEITTALLFCVLIVVSIAKVVRRLL